MDTLALTFNTHVECPEGRIDLEMSWDYDDPYAVKLFFPAQNITWVCSFEDLYECAFALPGTYYGRADIKWIRSQDYFGLQFSVPDGVFHYKVSHANMKMRDWLYDIKCWADANNIWDRFTDIIGEAARSALITEQDFEQALFLAKADHNSLHRINQIRRNYVTGRMTRTEAYDELTRIRIEFENTITRNNNTKEN